VNNSGVANLECTWTSPQSFLPTGSSCPAPCGAVPNAYALVYDIITPTNATSMLTLQQPFPDAPRNYTYLSGMTYNFWVECRDKRAGKPFSRARSSFDIR
jgi:hypothetical protein